MSEHTHSPACRHMLSQISDYIDGELQQELCARLEEHLKGCPNCRVVLNSLRKTVELYQQTTTPAGLPVDVRERLFYSLNLKDHLQKP